MKQQKKQKIAHTFRLGEVGKVILDIRIGGFVVINMCRGYIALVLGVG